MEYIVVGIIIWFIIWGIVASFMNQVVYEKGYDSEAHAFAMCFWLGILGCLYVIALPDKNLKKQNEKIISLLKEKNNKIESTQIQPDNYDDLPSL